MVSVNIGGRQGDAGGESRVDCSEIELLADGAAGRFGVNVEPLTTGSWSGGAAGLYAQSPWMKGASCLPGRPPPPPLLGAHAPRPHAPDDPYMLSPLVCVFKGSPPEKEPLVPSPSNDHQLSIIKGRRNSSKPLRSRPTAYRSSSRQHVILEIYTPLPALHSATQTP